MQISLKARNSPKLAGVWIGNILLFLVLMVDGWFSSHLADILSLSLIECWPYAGFLAAVSVFNGLVPRRVKERIIFWKRPRPGSRAFSHYMNKDSTIDKLSIREKFDPLPVIPDQQNALWAGWLHEFENDARVRHTYGMYLFARDWSLITVAALFVGSPFALVLSGDFVRTLLLIGILVCQYFTAIWLANVQSEQLVTSGSVL